VVYEGGAAQEGNGEQENGHKGQARVVLEWVGGSEADMMADAVVAVVLQSAGQPPAVCDAELVRHKALQAGDMEAATRAELGLVSALMSTQFGPAQVDEEQSLVFVDVDGKHVIINGKSGQVQCADDALRGRVEKSLARLNAAMHPCEVGAEA